MPVKRTPIKKYKKIFINKIWTCHNSPRAIGNLRIPDIDSPRFGILARLARLTGRGQNEEMEKSRRCLSKKKPKKVISRCDAVQFPVFAKPDPILRAWTNRI